MHRKDNEKRKDVIITARIDAGIKKKLIEYCNKNNKTQSKTILEALDQYMEKHADDYKKADEIFKLLNGGEWGERKWIAKAKNMKTLLWWLLALMQKRFQNSEKEKAWAERVWLNWHSMNIWKAKSKLMIFNISTDRKG